MYHMRYGMTVMAKKQWDQTFKGEKQSCHKAGAIEEQNAVC